MLGWRLFATEVQDLGLKRKAVTLPELGAGTCQLCITFKIALKRLYGPAYHLIPVKRACSAGAAVGILKNCWHGGLEEEAGRSPFSGNGLEGALTEQKSVAAPTERPWGWERWKCDELQSVNTDKLQGYITGGPGRVLWCSRLGGGLEGKRVGQCSRSPSTSHLLSFLLRVLSYPLRKHFLTMESCLSAKWRKRGRALAGSLLSASEK